MAAIVHPIGPIDNKVPAAPKAAIAFTTPIIVRASGAIAAKNFANIPIAGVKMPIKLANVEISGLKAIKSSSPAILSACINGTTLSVASANSLCMSACSC